MSSYLLVFFSALSAAVGLFLLRKVLDYKGHPSGYLSIFYFFTFLMALVMNVRARVPFSETFDLKMGGVGIFAGALAVAMMFSVGRALKLGPSGISFAFQNSGAVLPPLVMVLLFQAPFGFALTIGNVLGMGLVVAGLFWAANSSSEEKGKNKLSRKWALYAILSFIFQGVLLCLYQWKCFLTCHSVPEHGLIPFKCAESGECWFMPAMFISAWIFQILIFGVTLRRGFHLSELLLGCVGGIGNTFTTIFLLQATKVAHTPSEKAMIFPLFAGLMILLCSFSGRLFYKERINWPANLVCVAGILIGTFI